MKTPLLAAFLLMAAGAAGVAEPRPSARLCDKAKSAGRGYFECLETTVRETDQALTEANQKAKTAVDLRGELAATQRTRWKNAVDEAQALFVRFRNFERQNVAPDEGGIRIGAFEERLACLIDKNAARIRDLQIRYGKQ